MRSLWTPTVPTASNFHSARCFSGFSLTQRLVCHLCHKHCRQQRIGAVHVYWLATPACGETSLVIECAASYLNNIKLCSSAFAPPILLQICSQRSITCICMARISRFWSYPHKRWTFQSCYWLCLLHLPALPQPARDFAVMPFLITWKFPVRAQPLSVPKMAGAHSMWSFNTFFLFDIQSFHSTCFPACSENTIGSLTAPRTAQRPISRSQRMHFFFFLQHPKTPGVLLALYDKDKTNSKVLII